MKLVEETYYEVERWARIFLQLPIGSDSEYARKRLAKSLKEYALAMKLEYRSPRH